MNLISIQIIESFYKPLLRKCRPHKMYKFVKNYSVECHFIVFIKNYWFIIPAYVFIKEYWITAYQVMESARFSFEAWSVPIVTK